MKERKGSGRSREKWSNHFFSVGEANQRGNANARLSCDELKDSFLLEMRNWYSEDFGMRLAVPEYAREILKGVIKRATTVKLGVRGGLLEGGLPYSVRVVRPANGYQVFVSFALEAPIIGWTGRIAGIDINPEGIACTITSRDGNLVATRFLRNDCLITASKNKRKWVLENIVNRMLRWCRDTHGCNAVAVEDPKFKGAYDHSPRTNFKLSNFMKKKMLQTIRLHALKMGMLAAEACPAYSSKVALAKYGRLFRGFNRHHLAAFVIARRALGYGEAPVLGCFPRMKKEKVMWNHCIRYYGYQPRIQTLPHSEPMEWKSYGDDNGRELVTKLLTAPPAVTPSLMGLSHTEGVEATEMTNERASRVHPNRHTNGGDGARGHGVGPPGTPRVRQRLSSSDKECCVR